MAYKIYFLKYRVPKYTFQDIERKIRLIPTLHFTIASCKSDKEISFPKERKLPRKIPAKIGRKEAGQTQLFLPEGNSCSLPFSKISPGKGDEKDKSPKNIFPKEKASSSNFPKLQKV